MASTTGAGKVAYEGWSAVGRSAKNTGLTAPKLIGVGVATGVTSNVAATAANQHFYGNLKKKRQAKKARKTGGGLNGIY